MRRYKIVACILLILSVFSFVLAAPVAVQEAREACADVVDGGDNVIIGSGKRADVQEEDPLLAQAQQDPSSSSDWRSTPSQDQGSSSAPNYASGTHPNPSLSSGDSKPSLLSTSGGTKVLWNPLAEGGANLIQPGTSTEIQPASSSNRKSVSWAPEREVRLPSGEMYSEMLPPDVEPLPRPLFMDAIQAKVAAHQSKKPQFKNIFRKLLGKLKFKFSRRISRTAGGVVTEG
jgi:hypothetical protein